MSGLAGNLATSFKVMAILQFRASRLCSCFVALFALLKRLLCRSGRSRKRSGESLPLPTSMQYSAATLVPHNQPDLQSWDSWEEDGPTSVRVEGDRPAVNNSTLAPVLEPEVDYFSGMAPTIRKTQKILIKKKLEALGKGVDGHSLGGNDLGDTHFSSRLTVVHDLAFTPPSAELGELQAWNDQSGAWDDQNVLSWETEEVLKQQRLVERERRAAEQLRKKQEKEQQRQQRRDVGRIAVKLP
uniref:receptor-binding cancer antigen expressed on SiSo cells isoform X2 n=1 Tax=Myxine glutinosa TaxID=7769 RepID=UPI00358DEA0A